MDCRIFCSACVPPVEDPIATTLSVVLVRARCLIVATALSTASTFLTLTQAAALIFSIKLTAMSPTEYEVPGLLRNQDLQSKRLSYLPIIAAVVFRYISFPLRGRLIMPFAPREITLASAILVD